MPGLINKQALPRGATISVLGSGISGLTFAYFLGNLRPDVKIDIYEKSSKIGGWINSQRTNIKGNSTILEKGPRTLRGVSPGTLLIVDILHRTGHGSELFGIHKTSTGNSKFILAESVDSQGRSGELVRVPDDGKGLYKFLASSASKGLISGLLKEPFIPKIKHNKEETIQEFFTRRFGENLILKVGSAIMYGIYAADVSKLSIRAVMPRLAAFEDSHGSILRYVFSQIFQSNKPEELSEEVKSYERIIGSDLDLNKTKMLLKKFPVLALQGGLIRLPQIIKENLPDNVSIIHDSRIKGFKNCGNKLEMIMENDEAKSYDHVRSTVSATELAKIVDVKDLKDSLNKFEYSSVAVVNVFVPEKNFKHFKGFGFLIPKAMFNPHTRLMGVIFDSDVESCCKRIFNDDVEKELTNRSTAVDKEKLSKLALQIEKQDSVLNVDYTKVTFMVSIDKEKPSESKIRKIISDTFENLLGKPINETDWYMENYSCIKSIPLYDTQYLDLKKQSISEADNDYQGKLSLGGMTFAQGIGVPDAVSSSFKSAANLSGKMTSAEYSIGL